MAVNLQSASKEIRYATNRTIALDNTSNGHQQTVILLTYFPSKVLSFEVSPVNYENSESGNIRAVAGQRARLLLTFVKHKAKPDQ